MTPRCTYRLQLSREFDFDAAAGVVGYLHSLGVSHVYCSPILQAVPGSTHGYDVVDPTRISADLGGETGFRRLVDAARAHGMELLVDIVPNHMATAGRDNPWWWDLLAHGPGSTYADYFDVDWDPTTSAVKDKVVLGVLGDRYGRELETGALRLEREDGTLVVRYHEHSFPISPETAGGANARDADALDALLEHQHYRLTYWRSAQEELNYRRFFTVDTLIGLRVERPQVFDAAHHLVLELVRSGDVTGLRVDHVDGLREPDAYLRRLRAGAPNAYIVVEKVLAAGESLPAAFPVQGTTGYDFISAVDGLFVDAEAEAAMTAIYHAFTGEPLAYAEVVRASKQHILTTELAPDVERLGGLLVEICERRWRQRDRTRRELLEALREVAGAFAVYRTYVTPEKGATDEDASQIEAAVAEAMRRRPDIDPDLLSFIGDVLRLRYRGALEEGFAARFQQITPAVMAKGLEDTASYRYNRLVSLNEVGGDPGLFGRPVARFHEWCAGIAETRPETMLTLSTHDTKRSADVRARIDLLSEMPAEWEPAVRRWAEHNDRHRSQGIPDRNLEYLAYQTLVGAWPVDATRLTEFLVKAAREAKVHTSWADPVGTYEDAVRQFAVAITSDAEFTADFESFVGGQQIVAHGRVTSLAQTALLLCCPGIPDIYQGGELRSLDLVDPDNRRPVDFESRRRLLEELRDVGPEEALARGDIGATKLWMIARLLAHRPAGGYRAVEAAGAKARHAVSFLRGDRMLVIVPRLVHGLHGDWGDTTIPVPAGSWMNILTGDRCAGGRAVQVAELTARFPVAVLERPEP
ncbi:MAG TPA: malto-oligosyltrehalose synthase [Candidatus Dormibacteraeota bacterium]|nr:malto-oligosyltrehalose synthase [Candidatus Dormibacteraeota bacterium]